MPVSYFQGVMLSIPTSFVICFASDFICQELEILVAGRKRRLAIESGAKDSAVPSEKAYDYRRTMIFAGVGGIFFGPMSYSRYLILDLILPDGNGPSYVVLKTMASSLAYTPIMTAIGMGSNEYLSPKGTWSSVFQRIRNEFWKVLLAGYVFKVITTLITMSFPGTDMKFAVSQVVGMVQNVFTSWRIYASLEEEKAKAKVLEVEPNTKKEEDHHATDVPTSKEVAPAEVTVEKEL